MLKVGLTGGIACGKSVVATMFAARGVHVIKADEISHQLMCPGTDVYDAVVEHFGREILDSSGAIDRLKLAALVFDPHQSRVEELNRLVHPAVIAEQDRWADDVRRRDPDGIAMVEAALILEAGVRSHFDRLVVVSCEASEKAERLAARMGIDLEEARRELERRSRAQWPDDEKVRVADFIIDNSDSLAATERQVERVFGELQRAAEGSINR
jgi:dephospho-CoA kinase